ncbi:hypothetical protein DK1_00004 [Bacillus phage DK1]|uniref:Uncharacterized protein n=1 Tax=Bacillus phage DK1 TaxID=2500808 RepID=A0A3T0IIR6_9CAUD|nr:nucleotide kinase [Bacillus phage DK1]AZU99708.1 hypothetical protein DK1_00004 [Bacillus phage DK1]
MGVICIKHRWFNNELPCIYCKPEREDVINKPNHYHGAGIDPISIGENIFTKEEMNGFYKMNMLKYWYRAGKKDGNSKEQDLNKYEFYRKKLEENK